MDRDGLSKQDEQLYKHQNVYQIYASKNLEKVLMVGVLLAAGIAIGVVLIVGGILDYTGNNAMIAREKRLDYLATVKTGMVHEDGWVETTTLGSTVASTVASTVMESTPLAVALSTTAAPVATSTDAQAPPPPNPQDPADPNAPPPQGPVDPNAPPPQGPQTDPNAPPPQGPQTDPNAPPPQGPQTDPNAPPPQGPPPPT